MERIQKQVAYHIIYQLHPSHDNQHSPFPTTQLSFNLIKNRSQISGFIQEPSILGLILSETVSNIKSLTVATKTFKLLSSSLD